MMLSIGVIGTAGRQRAITIEEWVKMQNDFIQILQEALRLNPGSEIHLVSGGAAGADALAPWVFLNHRELVKKITIHLPGLPKDRKTSRYYWERFKPIFDVETALSILYNDYGPAEVVMPLDTGKGFHARNVDVARDSTHLLVAYTFSGGANVPRDGGTKHTWDVHKKVHPGVLRISRDIDGLGKGGVMKGKTNIPSATRQRLEQAAQSWRKTNNWLFTLAKGMAAYRHGVAAGTNPKVNCNNCHYGRHLPNEWQTFDFCTHPLIGKKVAIPIVGWWDNLDEREKPTTQLPLSDAEEQVAVWEAKQEDAILRWLHRDDRDFSHKGGENELLKPYQAEVFVSRAMFILVKIGKEYVWEANPSYCPFHHYNMIASKGRLDPDLAKYHLRSEYEWAGDGKKFHVHPRHGVEYFEPEWMTLGKERVMVYVPKINCSEYQTMAQVLGVWKDIQREAAILRSQGLESYVIPTAIARVKSKMLKPYRERFFYYTKGKLSDGSFNLAALQDTKEYLAKAGVELSGEEKPAKIFAEYRKLKAMEKGMAMGQPGSCPALRYVPDQGTDKSAGSYLFGVNACTSKGTLITEERQKGWSKVYFLTVGEKMYKAVEWNALSVEDRKLAMGCACKGGCPVLGDDTPQEFTYVESILDDNLLESAIDNRINELEKGADDFTEGLFLVSTETGQKTIDEVRHIFGM